MIFRDPFTGYWQFRYLDGTVTPPFDSLEFALVTAKLYFLAQGRRDDEIIRMELQRVERIRDLCPQALP